MKAPDLPCNNNSRKIKRGAILWDGGRLVLIGDVYVGGTYSALAAYTPSTDKFEIHPLDAYCLANLRPASDREARGLRLALADYGWQWNDELKDLEKRSRCEGGTYYYLTSGGDIREAVDLQTWTDSCRWEDHNYYFSVRAAKREAERVKDAIRNGYY